MKMRLLFFFISLLFLQMSHVVSQVAVGQWRVHLPYQNVFDIEATESGKIFCANRYSLYAYDPSDNSLSVYNKTNSLSDIGPTAIAYSKDYNTLVIGYSNTNLDLIKNGNVINISDILRANIVGEKTIYDIQIQQNLAYIACSFGIVVLDIDREEIKDTYLIGPQGSTIRVYETSIEDKQVYAATELGIYIASTDAVNLANFTEWVLQDSIQNMQVGAASSIIQRADSSLATLEGAIWIKQNTMWEAAFSDSAYFVKKLRNYQDRLFAIVDTLDLDPASKGEVIGSMILQLDTQFKIIKRIKNASFPNDIYLDDKNIIWIADEVEGLIKIENDLVENYVPQGPNTANVFKITAHNNIIWVAPGGVNESWNLNFNLDGVFKFEDNNWYAINQYTEPTLSSTNDILVVTPNPSTQDVYFGSYGGGVVKYGTKVTMYKQNSSLQTPTGDPSSYRATGLTFDDEGNLWVSNYGAADPLSVLKPDGTWQAFDAPRLWEENSMGEIVIDDANQKWIILAKRAGLMVFNHGEDIEDQQDDQYAFLQKGEGAGNLPSTYVRSIAKDKDGEIWVGTDQGIGVFYCPELIFEPEGCEAQQILVEQDGFNGYLLETEIINSIAVDGANRKWIGTTNGVWLMSADGTEQIEYFNTENSPLLSDVVLDIEINEETGEVFIGTEGGIISYQGTATTGTLEHSNVHVFPNPVHPDYEGQIAVQGLVRNADVKITDVVGNLVYQTQANGGMAVWDGKNYNGEKVATGVYLIYSANSDGSEKYVAKVLFLN